jgi:hypothetical protein
MFESMDVKAGGFGFKTDQIPASLHDSLHSTQQF